MEAGTRAPAFTLPDQDGKPVKLSDFRGQWLVLYFYPKDDTPGCTTEACEFTSSLAEFNGMDAVVLGCSADSPESHRKFIAKYDIGFPLLSDVDAEMMTRYGAWGEKTLYGKKMTGVLRSTVLIDPDGKVAHHWANVRAEGHAAKVRETLARLRG